jgi:hypothetical protein
MATTEFWRTKCGVLRIGGASSMFDIATAGISKHRSGMTTNSVYPRSETKTVVKTFSKWVYACLYRNVKKS